MAEKSLQWFDSHCHIHEDPDPRELITQGVAEGLGGVVLVGTTYKTTKQALNVAAALRVEFADISIGATAGIHPHDAGDALVNSMADFESFVESSLRPSLCAIGECGLDFFYDYSDRDSQRKVFLRQIDLANRSKLPLVIHTRDAWDETFAILSTNAETPIIFHCFTGGPAELERCLEFDSYVSFSGIVTFKKSQDNAEAALVCPVERMLVETDSPYLTPVPLRGNRNVPQNVALVGQFIAKLKEIDVRELAAVTSNNARTAFSI